MWLHGYFRRTLFRFPNPVNEVSARLVAAGVVVMCAATLVFDQRWIIVPLAYGFVARVLTGPTLSPLGQFVTRVLTPRAPVRVEARCRVRPKRFAQGIGAFLSVTALVLAFGFDATTEAYVCVAFILVAATLESVFAYCLGCKIFALLMRAGVIPESVCVECGDIWNRRGLTAPNRRTTRAESAALRRSHARNPPTRSVARCSPRSWRLAAARLDE